MKTKHYLLSYKWQTAGWILLAVAEDEFIKSLRGRSLAAAACVAFALSIIWFCVSNVGRMYLPSQMGDDLWWKFSLVDNYLSIIPMFFLYIVIFKASLWVYRWRSRHEE